MATLRDIKRRIKGVQNTQQITKAMKMVSAAKLRRAQENIMSARPYAKKIFSLFSHLVSEEDKQNNIFLVQREVKNVAVMVVSADRGLCGAFNTNIIKETAKYLQDESESNKQVVYHLYSVGKKGHDFFSKRNYNILGKNIGLFSSLKYDMALSISEEIINGYLNGKFDKVIVIYNEFKSIIQQKIVVEQFLPIPVHDETERGKVVQPNYIFEPDQQSIFNYLLPKHLKAQLWRILLESNASELGARMTAMDNATTNAKELIRTLQLKYNRERQAAITKEILEIVSGANALKSS